MSETNRLLNEIAKNTRKSTGCCFNKTGQTQISAGGTDTKIFEIGSFHSYAFLCDSGATVEISYDSDPAVEYSVAGVDTNDTVNAQQVTFVATAGTTTIIWKYK